MGRDLSHAFGHGSPPGGLYVAKRLDNTWLGNK